MMLHSMLHVQLLPVVIQKAAALLTCFLAHCRCCLSYEGGFVQFHAVKRIVRQSETILVEQICIAMLACRHHKRLLSHGQNPLAVRHLI